MRTHLAAPYARRTLITCALTVAALLLGAVPALAAGPSITGRVTGENSGAALLGVEVTLVQLDPASEEVLDVLWSETDAEGTYLFLDLAPGTYLVYFEDPSGSYIAEAYDNRPWYEDGDLVTVTSESVSGIDAALAPAGHIAGTVTAPDDGPVEGVIVMASLYDSEWDMWMPYNAAVVEANGSYSVDGLPSGTYRLEFWDPDGRYAPVFYENAGSLSDATDIAVIAGSTSADRDITLSTAARICGRVTGPSGTGVPYAQITVWSYNVDYDEWEETTWGEASVDGYYDVGGLAAGEYRVSAYDLEGDYVQRSHPAVAAVEDGTSVTLLAAETREAVDITLGIASHITGRVTAENGGASLAEVEVYAYAYDPEWEDWWPIAWTCTEADGTYNLSGLDAGTYRIEFWDWNEEYAGEFYDNIKTDVYSANDVTVTIGATRSAINAALTRRGGISGTTTSKLLGTPVPGIEVTLYAWDGSEWFEWDTTTGDTYGRFEFPRLYAGNYRLGFNDPEGTFSDQYYDQKTTLSAATTVAVTDGTTTTIMARLIGSKGAITGVVRDAQSAAALPGMSVTLHSPFDVGHAIASTTTGANGAYLFEDVTAGTYVIKFSDSHGVYASQFYPANVYQEDLACRVTVSDDVMTTANTSLRRAGRISGKVISAVTGLPLSGITVQAGYMLSPTSPLPLLPTATTAADGTYALGGLFPGTYHIVFTDPAKVWGMQTYNGITPEETLEFYVGTNVTVTSGTTTANINGSLRSILAIRGTVTADGGSAAGPGGWVRLYRRESTWVEAGAVGIQQDGTYAFNNIGKGTYRLRFDGYAGSGMVKEYYAGWPTFDGATDIVVTDHVEIASTDLGRPCTITGRVSAETSGAPLPGTRVEFYRHNLQTDQWAVAAAVETGDDGTYSITGLLKGEYRIQAVPADRYVSEFADDAVTAEDASSVVLASGGSAIVDFELGLSVDPDRLSGSSRYATAIDVAKNTFPAWEGVTDVIIASGEDRAAPDPLAAAGLVWTYQAPLLLVKGTEVPAEVEAAIAAMPDGVRLHIIGGTKAVSEECERVLAAIASVAETTRTAGATRYATAAEVAREMKRVRGAQMADFALIANGANERSYVDALSMSPLSAAQGAPILLVGADTIPSETNAVLDELDPSEVFVAGGNRVVSDRIVGILGAERWAGADQYATAATIGRNAVERGWLSYSIVGIAASLPDALGGGCTLGLDGGTMLLTQKDALPTATAAALRAARLDVTECRVFGGPGTITDTNLERILAALR